MARWYDTVFETPKGLVTVRSQGNTRTSAERWARSSLKRAGFDLTKCWTIRTSFVDAGDTRARTSGILR